MPHKRAKFSERAADKARKGKDLPPANDMHFQSLPKGAMRILNAAKIQADFHEKKRQRELQQASKGKGKAEEKPLQIKGGEKISDFNRRVESTMAKEVRSSIRATQNSTKKRRNKDRQSAEDGASAPPEESFAKPSSSSKNASLHKEADSKTLKRQREAIEGKPERQQEWEKAASRKRVNDVVKAPPTLTKAPRGESAEAKKRKLELKALLSGREGDEDAHEMGGKARLPEPVKKGGLRREAMLQEERERVVKEYRQNKKRMLER